MAWYVVYSKPRAEHIAAMHLNNQGFKTLNPSLRLKKRRSAGLYVVEEPLFPRYLFVNLEEGQDDFSKIRSTRGCVDLVRFGSLPKVVADELIQSIEQGFGADGVLDITASYTQRYSVGQKVQVVEGAFSGLMTEITALKPNDRVLVLLDLMGSCRQVELPVSCLE